MPEVVGENVDRAVTIEMRPHGLPRGLMHRLYAAAREEKGRPLTLAAAEGLLQNLSAGDAVIFGTGAGSPPFMPQGENDGPMGTAALARALSDGVGAFPIVVCADHHIEPVIASLKAIGLGVMDPEAARRKRLRVAVVLPYSKDDAEGRRQAAALLDEWRPKALVAIEKLGPNAKGQTNTATGNLGAAPDAKIYTLFDEARGRGIFSVGIADGGNEIGSARIYDAVREIHPYGKTCQDGCGAGIATVTPTDVLVMAAISNWGAYGVAAMVAFLLKRPELLHSAAMEDHMLLECTRAGAFDGGHGAPVLAMDGTPRDCGPALITILHGIIGNALSTVDRGW